MRYHKSRQNPKGYLETVSKLNSNDQQCYAIKLLKNQKTMLYFKLRLVLLYLNKEHLMETLTPKSASRSRETHRSTERNQ